MAQALEKYRHGRSGIAIEAGDQGTLALRGKADLGGQDGERVVSLRGDAIEEYVFLPSPAFLAAAAALSDEQGVLRFVQRYGLLFEAPELDDDARPEWQKAGRLMSFDERVGAYLALAFDLQAIRRLYALAERATYADRYSIAALRRALADFLTERQQAEDLTIPRDTNVDSLKRDELVALAAAQISVTTSMAIEEHGARFLLGIGSSRGEFALLPASPTLAGHAWLQVAAEVLQRLQLRACETCEAVFAVTDPRQRYCSSRCGNTARARRFRANHAFRRT